MAATVQRLLCPFTASNELLAGVKLDRMSETPLPPERSAPSPGRAAASDTNISHRLDHDACYSAISRRDSRFDGRFYTAVTSTGIFCRPSCPARTPRSVNVRFYQHAASAIDAGFRPCRRCRPELAPGHREWNRRQDLVGRAVSLIDQGALDHQGVGDLANRLGVSERHLRRELRAELGTGPVQLARTRRLSLARTLLDQTSLQVSDIAFASGFASIRQFNDVFKQAFNATPSELRRRPRPEPNRPTSLVLQLPARGGLDWPQLHSFLAYRAIAGLEHFDETSFTRLLPQGSVTLGGLDSAKVSIADSSTSSGLANSLRVEFSIDDLSALSQWIPTLRQVCDLDTDVGAVTEALRSDSRLAPLMTEPVPRLPGAFDRFEIAVRAVVGQQISVPAARTTLGRLVALAGTGSSGETSKPVGHFPTPEQFLAMPLDEVGMPTSRRNTLRALAQAVAEGSVDLTDDAGVDKAGEDLLAIKGVGPWTAGYITMRAFQHPDGWPDNDLILVQAAERSLGLNRGELAERSKQWRPWRAYAALTLWRQAGQDEPRPTHRPVKRGPIR